MQHTKSNSASILLTGRGRLLTADEIAALIFCNTKSARWVRQTVAPMKKLTFGHSTVRWWEADVMEWIDGHGR